MTVPSRSLARRWLRLLPTALALLALPLVIAACSASGEPPLPTEDAFVQGIVSEVIPGRLIVTVRGGVDPAQVASDSGVRPDFTYRTALNGFAGHVGDAARAGLMADARVLRIEPDRTVHAFALETQTNATWGLDRVDQHERPLDTRYTYEQTAAGVHAYVIDTGIRLDHQEFAGRIATGFDAVTSGGDASDCNGHGTHVAGTIGGTTYGVAKQVTLVPVRVLGCTGSGTIAGVIAGIDWVTEHRAEPAVANMSLGGGASTALDDAVRASIGAGITYAVAAGNGNIVGRQQPACNYSPARVPEALTVGATTNTSDDAKASWSNYGDCVDIFAPGVGITSAWHTSTTATNTISGTSMASPHVAGVAALYLAANPLASPEAVFQAVFENATQDAVANSSTSNNHLVYSLFGEVGGGDEPPPDADQPPGASFSASCSELSCTFTDTSTDAAGSITSWSWSFGDGGTSSAQNPSHTYSADGDYTVALTVTAEGGETDTATQDVTVAAAPPPPEGFVLSVQAYRVTGRHHVDLDWEGASSQSVDVYRDGALLATTANNGSFTDSTNNRGGGSYTYRVCEAGTDTCSNEATAAF